VFSRSGVRRIPGGLRVRLTPDERDVLHELPAELRELLTGASGPDSLLARLFPPAYEDPADEAEYQVTAGDAVAEHRSETLDRFLTSFHKGEEHRDRWTVSLDADEAHAWLQVVNDTRLVLATAEGINDESDWDAGPDPSRPRTVLLYWLGWFEEQLVAALMSSLDE
jgi:hypothetical protein